MEDQFFCGVEGGASVSKLVLVSSSGKVLDWVVGPSSNHLLYGLEACQKRIAEMIIQALKNAGLKENTVLAGLGLCMSGCEAEDANKEFEKTFLEKYSHLTKSCKVASDTTGALYTASPKGALILIAGTGSNALLVNPNGTTARCGGWGHLIGDEASAMWISLKAVKTVFDAEDDLAAPPHDISRVKLLMLEHFCAQDKFGILEHCYVKFNKSFFAGLCEKLAQAATNNDKLCQYLFEEAGKVLADMVLAILPKVQKELLDESGGLPIVCVGSVFKSWNLLKPGFVARISDKPVPEFTMLALECSAAIGAAYLGAKVCGVTLPLDLKENTSVLYHYVP